ncbi:papain fold toxin domain-containing protein [Iningainema tapete]|uniref:Tox-PL-2 domain-containing protein n=1 Tax=Iningainema tapete BLCC-T55 TaxID=2748662 RepID=A0A8J6XN66_9CYAN|nr:papain fold toxin domain-containing protein [Iningainema tapete]MBD2774111.1 hypothetical protein [Iningainema tapete BLCC-T55]
MTIRGDYSTDKDSDIRQQIKEIASRYQLFQWVECARAIKEFLIARGISGKQIKVDLEYQDLPWSVIYDLRREQQIATNGHHEGISIVINGQEIVFDNIDHYGVTKEEWWQNFTSPTVELGRGSFNVTELDF